MWRFSYTKLCLEPANRNIQTSDITYIVWKRKAEQIRILILLVMYQYILYILSRQTSETERTASLCNIKQIGCLHSLMLSTVLSYYYSSMVGTEEQMKWK